jgi:hypothetical protein
MISSHRNDIPTYYLYQDQSPRLYAHRESLRAERKLLAAETTAIMYLTSLRSNLVPTHTHNKSNQDPNHRGNPKPDATPKRYLIRLSEAFPAGVA